MAGLKGAPRGSKRERLVASATDLLYRNGAARTTLADVASAADVPLGNVYYYFKTKDELIRAVIDGHAAHLRQMLASFDQRPDPRDRLRAFTGQIAEIADMAACYGCPQGSLCGELGKHDDGLATAAAALMALRVDWAEEQFRLMGRGDARDLAVNLVSTIQGACELANAFRDAQILRDQVSRLDELIDAIASASTSEPA